MGRCTHSIEQVLASCTLFLIPKMLPLQVLKMWSQTAASDNVSCFYVCVVDDAITLSENDATSKALKCKPSALVVDSMRESIHALRCVFLSLQDTQRKREFAIQLIDGLGYFVVVSR